MHDHQLKRVQYKRGRLPDQLLVERVHSHVVTKKLIDFLIGNKLYLNVMKKPFISNGFFIITKNKGCSLILPII